MEKISNRLFEYQDEKYGDFIHRLTPTISRDNFIGVRVPNIKKIIKELSDEEIEIFLNELPHKYYEEGLLHGFLVQRIKNYDKCIKRVNEFLPFVNNWATSDTMIPKCFYKNKDDVFKHITKWIISKETYTVRFSILCLMNLFMDDEFKEEYLLIPASVKSEEYYINIMIAWYYATALTKQYNVAIKLIEHKILPKWIHNKAIQKAIESRKIPDDRKEYLKTLKIK